MLYTPHPIYRSDACRELDERIQRGETYESLDVKVNIDGILPHRNSDFIEQVALAIEESTNFVLFADKTHYIIIIPCKLAVACYVDGVPETLEVMKDMQQFQNRVKIAFAVYDKFARLDRSLEGGGNGDAALPLYPKGKDLPDGEDGKGSSEAVIPE